MKLRSLTYFLEEAARNIVRNSLMSVTSVITVSASVFMLVFLLAVAINIDSTLAGLETATSKMTVFIKDGSSQEDIDKLQAELEAIEYIDSVTFVSSKEAFEEFATTLPEDARDTLTGLPEDEVLESRFNISFGSARFQDAVLSAIEPLEQSNPAFSKVRHMKKEIDALTTVNGIIRVVCIIIIVILLTLSVIIIINTIKLAVNNRKTEISIMKYVGATDGFIKCPFIMEGLFIGVFGAIIPIVLFGLGYDGIMGVLTERLEFLGVASFATGTDIFPLIVPMSVLFGGLIGTVGSLVSLRRYLDV